PRPQTLHLQSLSIWRKTSGRISAQRLPTASAFVATWPKPLIYWNVIEGKSAMKNLPEQIKLSLQATVLILASTCCLFAQTLNFDSLPVPPPNGGGSCVDATGYLASFGITVTNVTPGALIGACQNVEVSPSSPPNYFNGLADNIPVTYTLNFPH